jgi:glycosyltransferase involved in cell wall biosynthesis
MLPKRSAIAIANYDFRSSGTVAKSIEIASAAARAGLPVELWALRGEGDLRDRVPEGLPVHVLASGPPTFSRAADMILATRRLALTLHRRRPALVLSGGNHLHRVLGIALRLSGARDQMRLVLRASNSSQRPNRAAPAVARRVRRKFGGADAVVAVSQALGAELRAARLPSPVSVIPNGVDLDRVAMLARTPFDHPFLDKGVPVLVSMGRLQSQKGFDIVIRAFAALRRRQDARLLLIGAGAESMRRALWTLAAEEGVADAIDMLGFRDNPFAILARCDLFVSGSRWEGASNTLIEALACGLPIVATDCPTGNREVVDRGPFGTLAQVDDVEGLAAAIEYELMVRRDRAAQAAGARHWALDRCLAQWIGLLEREYRAALALRA